MNREPWLAALLGNTFPGAGHFYAGARGTGAAMATLALGLLGVSVWGFVAPTSLAIAGWAASVLLAVLLVFSVAGAHRLCAHNATPEFAAERRAGGDGWKAVFLSGIFPGLGQFYARRPLPGIAFLAAGLVAAVLEEWPLVLAYAAVRGGAMLDAWRGGALRRGSPFAFARNVSLGLTLLLAGQLTLVAFTRTRLVRAFRIVSESMAPTLSPGDYMFVDLTRRGRAEPGDLVVIPFPPEPKQIFVERCVAVGGQTIEVRDKAVWVDGRRLAEPYVTHVDPNVRSGDRDARDNMPPFRVPQGHVFVMGDNRDNSYDSRFWGTVRTPTVLGRAHKRYWPLDRAGSLLGR